MQILIAEDDTTSRLVLERTLKKLGYGVLAARDGAEAWQMYEQERPPVVITDFVYPKDVARFAREFQLHIHHERSPEVTTINDGWGTQRGDGNVIGRRPTLIRPGTY